MEKIVYSRKAFGSPSQCAQASSRLNKQISLASAGENISKYLHFKPIKNNKVAHSHFIAGACCNVDGMNTELTLAIASRTVSSLNWLIKSAEDASGMIDIYVNNNEKTWTIINTNLSIVA
jgi:hypothetical protein